MDHTTPNARHLRPGFLVPSADAIWVLDDMEPVGALLDLVSGALLGVHAWPEVQPGPRPDRYPSTWRVVGHDGALWVQQPPGDLARIDREGSVGRFPSGGLELRTVSPHGAWCLGSVPPWSVRTEPEAQPPRGPGVVVLVGDEAVPRRVSVDTPVWEACTIDGTLYLLVETGHWRRRSNAPGRGWLNEPTTGWLRLAATASVPDRLGPDRYADSGPRRRPSMGNGGQRWGQVWLDPPPRENPGEQDVIAAAGEPAGDLRWRVGSIRDDRRPRRSGARGWDPASGRTVHLIDLGPGTVVAMSGTADHLWLAIDTPRPQTSYQPPAPASVARVDARTGAVQVVLPADTIDITGLGWALRPRPPDTAAYEEHWRARMVAEGSAYDGVRIPNPRRAVLVGSWPHTEVEIRFTSVRHPGKRLRRRLSLYDEIGRPTPPEYGDMHLDEDLASGAQPYRAPDGKDWLI